MNKGKIKLQHKTKTYAFKVIIEEDPFDDNQMAYHAYCPALNGASTWGYTKEEALKNIHEVVEMVVESMIAHKEVLPEMSSKNVKIFAEPLVAVTV